jgi:hypothetical protein
MTGAGTRALAATALAAALLAAAPAYAELSAEQLAKLAQNPIGNLISVPFQNNTNFNVGPLSGTQNILNIHPLRGQQGLEHHHPDDPAAHLAA